MRLARDTKMTFYYRTFTFNVNVDNVHSPTHAHLQSSTDSFGRLQKEEKVRVLQSGVFD